ncbi:MAG TPA: hypothetical protein VKA53_04290, partial [Thermoanaerobaculia bacterium]|nr:hypothetical protein [Thermoanaerobaculia bacterium]
GYENLLRLLNHLLASEAIIRRSEVGGLALEIALLRAAELPKLVRVEELLGGVSDTSPATPPGRRKSSRNSPAMAQSNANLGADCASTEAKQEAGAPPASPPRAPEADDPPSSPPGDASPMERFLQQVSLHKQSLAAHLSSAQALEFSDGELRIHHARDDRWLPKTLERSTNREALAAAIESVWGKETSWRLVAVEAGAGNMAVQGATPEQDQGEQETDPAAVEIAGGLQDDPAIQTVLDIFGGRIEGVDRIETPEEDQARQEDEPR